MRQVLTIGRGSHCDIILSDNTDVVSREHAVLEIDEKGNYYLTDTSRNGTYVNGIKISQYERVLVTPKDIISFAHACTLNWDSVPRGKSSQKILIWSVGGVLFVALLSVLFIWLIPALKNRNTIKVNSVQSFGLYDDGFSPVIVDDELEDSAKNQDSPDDSASEGVEENAPQSKNDTKKNASNQAESKEANIDAIY